MDSKELDRIVEEKIESYHPKGGLDVTSRFFLSLANINHPRVREHSQRVALLAEESAKRLRMDEKACFFAGILHDDGKIVLPYNLFDGRDITHEEYALVKKHARMGFEAIKDIHLFISLCSGTHHQLYKRGYGINIDDFPKDLSLETIHKILGTSVLISICDFVDAYNTRTTKIKDCGYVGEDGNPPTLKKMLQEKYVNDQNTIDVVLSVWDDLFGEKEQL